MIGTSVSTVARTALEIAVSWGTPIPAMIRVVQIEPGPMPTFTASTPARIRSLAPSVVATFPAMTSIVQRRFSSLTVSMTFLECP